MARAPEQHPGLVGGGDVVHPRGHLRAAPVGARHQPAVTVWDAQQRRGPLDPALAAADGERHLRQTGHGEQVEAPTGESLDQHVEADDLLRVPVQPRLTADPDGQPAHGVHAPERSGSAGLRLLRCRGADAPTTEVLGDERTPFERPAPQLDDVPVGGDDVVAGAAERPDRAGREQVVPPGPPGPRMAVRCVRRRQRRVVGLASRPDPVADEVEDGDLRGPMSRQSTTSRSPSASRSTPRRSSIASMPGRRTIPTATRSGPRTASIRIGPDPHSPPRLRSRTTSRDPSPSRSMRLVWTTGQWPPGRDAATRMADDRSETSGEPSWHPVRASPRTVTVNRALMPLRLQPGRIGCRSAGVGVLLHRLVEAAGFPQRQRAPRRTASSARRPRRGAAAVRWCRARSRPRRSGRTGTDCHRPTTHAAGSGRRVSR